MNLNNATNYVSKDQFPKLHSKWGDDGFERINTLLSNAVEMIGDSTQEEIIYAGFSENKSKYPNKVVAFVDCKNKNRYHICEKNIKQHKVPKPDKWNIKK
jgi:hypothetical protein